MRFKTVTIMKPVMRYHGAKYRLADWIQTFFPEHHTYVEPFGGAAGVLMQKPRSESEVYNDLDGDTFNVFRVLQDEESADKLARKLVFTPYSRDEFNASYLETQDPVEMARRTLIRSHMGFGSAGATKHKTGFRVDSAREYGTAAQLWAKYPSCIAAFCERLAGVLLENKPAIDVIQNHDRADTLFFVDPPYVHDTRQMGGNRRYYQHEMSDEDHLQLLEQLNQVKGYVVLSGYESDLYREYLEGWEVHKTSARISAGRGTGTRTECVWLNPACAEKQAQQELFA